MVDANVTSSGSTEEGEAVVVAVDAARSCFLEPRTASASVHLHAVSNNNTALGLVGWASDDIAGPGAVADSRWVVWTRL